MLYLIHKDQVKGFMGDKGYDTNKIRDTLKGMGGTAKMPNKGR
ncbi:hypothetical protein phytr_11960 [Candidatus Phycorickettsia trachydisci]|uniref:Transposase n=1 Tax=Candidatus Phycorickettsia trachydisci TaxID=2115978 RepID=A0A2P1PA25_9RICK|nr:hypothetical protein [Candidatus Phycorickettsia trachydisci]AVP88121.1 hypothetical protein phytr_11960 [Candidatus Phycorickettsia trachydisci]